MDDYYYAARWSRFQVLLSDLGALLTPRARAALAAWREPRGSGGNGGGGGGGAQRTGLQAALAARPEFVVRAFPQRRM